MGRDHVRRLTLLVATLAAACGPDDPTQVCTANSMTCEGKVLRICNSAGTAYTDHSCGLACVNSSCIWACNESEKRCEGSTSLTCNADRASWTSESCTSGCDPATGTCKVAECSSGQVQCSGSSLMTCSGSGTWTVSHCQYGCIPGGAACRQSGCTAGTKTCNGSKLTTCNADGTLTEALCEFGCDAAASPPVCKAAACDAGAKRCSPTQPRRVQTCRADRSGWNDGILCSSNCQDGVCTVPPCTTVGQQACRAGVSYHRDEIDECQANGTWQKAKTVCTTGSCADVGGTPKKYACGTCWEGERTCSAVGDDVMQCSDPMAGPSKLYTCSTYDICVAGACSTPLTLGASATANHKALAQAFVDCWIIYQGSTDNQMCFNLDAMASQAVSFGAMKSWVCDTAAASDFYIPSDYDVAKDLVGCGLFNNSEIFWWWDPVPAGSMLEACIWYHPSGGATDDEDTLDRCENFWLNP